MKTYLRFRAGHGFVGVMNTKVQAAFQHV